MAYQLGPEDRIFIGHFLFWRGQFWVYGSKACMWQILSNEFEQGTKSRKSRKFADLNVVERPGGICNSTNKAKVFHPSTMSPESVKEEGAQQNLKAVGGCGVNQQCFSDDILGVVADVTLEKSSLWICARLPCKIAKNVPCWAGLNSFCTFRTRRMHHVQNWNVCLFRPTISAVHTCRTAHTFLLYFLHRESALFIAPERWANKEKLSSFDVPNNAVA